MVKKNSLSDMHKALYILRYPRAFYSWVESRATSSERTVAEYLQGNFMNRVGSRLGEVLNSYLGYYGVFSLDFSTDSKLNRELELWEVATDESSHLFLSSNITKEKVELVGEEYLWVLRFINTGKLPDEKDFETESRVELEFTQRNQIKRSSSLFTKLPNQLKGKK